MSLKPARKAITATVISPKALTLPNKSKNYVPLQNALIMQKQMILENAKTRRLNESGMKKVVNIEPKPRNPFQRELYERVRDPQLKESWHILKERETKNHDPHHKAVLKFCQDLMNTKSTLKRIPSPDCKTIIVLD